MGKWSGNDQVTIHLRRRRVPLLRPSYGLPLSRSRCQVIGPAWNADSNQGNPWCAQSLLDFGVGAMYVIGCPILSNSRGKGTITCGSWTLQRTIDTINSCRRQWFFQALHLLVLFGDSSSPIVLHRAWIIYNESQYFQNAPVLPCPSESFKITIKLFALSKIVDNGRDGKRCDPAKAYHKCTFLLFSLGHLCLNLCTLLRRNLSGFRSSMGQRHAHIKDLLCGEYMSLEITRFGLREKNK